VLDNNEVPLKLLVSSNVNDRLNPMLELSSLVELKTDERLNLLVDEN
jgi:hypothetical protein